MGNDKDRGGALIIGGGLGALVATLLARRPVEAAPPEAKWDYLIELQEAQVRLLEQLLVAFGIAPELKVSTRWVAKDPEQIFSQDIRVVGTFFSDKMVDWTEGKRLAVIIQSSLDQACNTQLIGNYVDDMNRATTVGAVWPCPANSNISIRPAWDDWMPFIGVRITTAIAPAAGILNIWAVIQE